MHTDAQPRPPVDAGDGPSGRAILLAGIDLFGRQGFGATSVRQIAGAAGVTPPLIAYHFGSKEGLFQRCIDVVTRDVATALGAAVEQAADLRDLVRRLALAHLDFPQQDPAAVRLLLTAAYAPESAQPAVDFSGAWTGVLERVAARFAAEIENGSFLPRPGADPFLLTRHLFDLLHMAALAACRGERICVRHGQDERFDAATTDPVEDLCDQFFSGAGRPAAPASPIREDTR